MTKVNGHEPRVTVRLTTPQGPVDVALPPMVAALITCEVDELVTGWSELVAPRPTDDVTREAMGAALNRLRAALVGLARSHVARAMMAGAAGEAARERESRRIVLPGDPGFGRPS